VKRVEPTWLSLTCFKQLELHGKLYMFMNAQLPKTCQRQYDQIKSLMKKLCVLLLLQTYYSTWFRKHKKHKSTLCHLLIWTCYSTPLALRTSLYIVPHPKTPQVNIHMLNILRLNYLVICHLLIIVSHSPLVMAAKLICDIAVTLRFVRLTHEEPACPTLPLQAKF
jgi:hypothetical protein